MNFDWTEEQKELMDKVADLFKEDNLNALETIDDLAALKALTVELLGRLAGTGYLKAGVGPEGRSEALGLMAAMEALSGKSGSFFLAVECSARLCGGLLAGWGSDSQKAELLEPLQNGTLLGAVAVSEPAGADAQLQTVGCKEGDIFKVNGQKSFVTNGPIADCIAVAGSVDGKPAFFLIDPTQDGVTVGPRMATLGYNGMAVSALALKDVQVSADRVIGPLEDNGAVDYLEQIQDLNLVAASLGVIKRTYEGANAHARDHVRGKKPVYAHQEVRFRVSDIFTLYQTSQYLAYRASWFFAEGDPEAAVLINCAKVFSAESSDQVAQMGMQIMAGQGYLSGNPVEQGLRDAKFAGLAGRSSEVSRMQIADAVTKRFPV
jgi:alkylation response protein AidB-like acyl-CoA dehydrogenase